MQIILIKDIAEVVCLDAEKVDDLTKGSIDLFDWNVHTLCTTESETRNRRDFIHSVDWENLNDKGRLLQAGQELLYLRGLTVHLLL